MAEYLLTENTPIAVVLALLILGLLTWRLKPAYFRSLSWQSFGLAAALFWGSLVVILYLYAWDFYYSFFVPSEYHFIAPIMSVVFYFAWGPLLRWMALRLLGNPGIWFCLLGGFESTLEHAIAIYRYDILHIPALRGSTASSIFLFAYFEYVVYWGLVLLLTVPIDRLIRAMVVHMAAQRKDPMEG